MKGQENMQHNTFFLHVILNYCKVALGELERVDVFHRDVYTLYFHYFKSTILSTLAVIRFCRNNLKLEKFVRLFRKVFTKGSLDLRDLLCTNVNFLHRVYSLHLNKQHSFLNFSNSTPRSNKLKGIKTWIFVSVIGAN